MRTWRLAGLVAVLLCLVIASVELARGPVAARPDGLATDSSEPAAGRAALRGVLGPAPTTAATPPPAGPGGSSTRASGAGSPTTATGGGPSRSRILVGANVQVQDGETWQQANSRADASYGPLQMHRVFYPDLPPPWPGSRAAGGDLTAVVSFKAAPRDILAGDHDEELTDWFQSAPRDRDVYWVYYHEPEDNIEGGEFTAAGYRDAWRHLARLAGTAGNDRLHATLVLMCWTLESGSGRDWRDYHADAAVAVLGWDCYNSGGQREGYYIDPAERFAAASEVSRAVGKPWGIAEMGSELVAGDGSGQGRAAWLRQVGDHLRAHPYPPLWVAYFDSTVGGDFRLRDRPSQQAWRDFARATAG
jgi:hypothetical protein